MTKVVVDAELIRNIGTAIIALSLLGMLLTELRLIDVLPYLAYLPFLAVGFILLVTANQWEKRKEQDKIRDL